MCSPTYKIIACLFLLLFTNCYALDTTQEEGTCESIGFKKKTEPYANCVLELVGRKNNNAPIELNNPDDAACRNYGFKPQTNDYAKCRQLIDQQRYQATQQQAAYEEQKRQFDAQIAEQKRQRQLQASQALINYSQSMTPKPPPTSNQTIVLPGNKMMNCQTVGNVTNCF